MSHLLTNAEVIYSYTRSQALADGGLVDVTDTAKEAGFKIPVALTAAAWGDCVAWGGKQENACQDESGRLWDVLYMAAMAAIGNRRRRQVPYSLHRVPRWGSRAELVQLVMHIGPGDEGEPVITIMQPGED